MKYILKYTLALLLIAGFGTACDDFLNPSVDQNRETDEAINNVQDMEAVVLGVLDDLNQTAVFGRDFIAGPEVMSDNALSNGNSGRFVIHGSFNFTTTNSYSDDLWQVLYQAIAGTNIVINNTSIESSPEVDYVKGQAYALRAFAHMNLLLAFGQQFVAEGDPADGIPYVTTYNSGEVNPPRDPIATVWENIGNDFETAASLMDPALDDNDPVYMNYYAVKGLQSRYYLYTEEWDAAIAAADDVINNAGFTLIADSASYVETWASGSGPNSLFELAFTSTDRLGTDNIARIYRETNYGDVEATRDLFEAHGASDDRLALYTDYGTHVRLSGKYVDELGSENIRILRYSEVLLNKAEALANRNGAGDQAAALAIINEISAARGSATVYTTGSVAEVLAERRLELAFEGHRFFDLARNEMDIVKVDQAERIPGDIPYGSYLYAIPVPQHEINANSNMTQNYGYE